MSENSAEEQELFRRLVGSDKHALADAAKELAPPAHKEHLNKLREVDEYSLSKHWANVKTGFIYFGSVLLGLLVLCVLMAIIWVGYKYFHAIVDDTKQVSNFLSSMVDLLMVVFSTLFINYALTKKGK